MSREHTAFMVLINLIWGFALVAGKVSLEHFPPFLFAGLRFALIVMVLFPFLKVLRGRMKEVIIIALCAGPIGFGLFFLGLANADASVVAVVGQLGVPISAIMSVIFLKEEIHWRRWLGIVLSFGGIMIISFDPAVFTFITGILFIVASAFVGSIGTIFQRRIKNVGVFEMQAWVAAIAAPFMLGASLAFESNQWELMQSASLLAWSGIFYVAFASSLVGHAGIYYLLQRYEVSQTAPLTLMAPLFTVVFGVTLLDDTLTWRMALGGAVALTGVLIVNVRSAKKGKSFVKVDPS
ncbi:MAG: DMT family transporter [Alphaproteobacteria bacterium]|nr:EamA family transporter [Rhodobiaceae bacterium]MBO6543582.1 DMT family transporter [Alphaproteobacteria bacterium]MBO6627345.1 DMT family transporter [Alphaproteobacteria bacterium]MDF1626917.1 DMT family transporter [Parvibaculaceae bacterium]